MTRAEILQRLHAVLQRDLDLPAPVSTLSDSQKLGDAGLGLDSIEMMKLVCAVEEEFSITLGERQLSAPCFETVASLVTLIAALL